MPTNKQRREAARRHLERQLERRQEREARQKKVTLIVSVVGTLVLIAAIVATVVALSGGSDKKKSTASGASGSTTASTSATASTTPSATPSATPSTSYPKATGAAVTFDGVTVVGAKDLKGSPVVTSKSSKDATKLETKDLVVGTGTAATATSTVTVQYTGVLYKNGTLFDSSWSRGMPAVFSLSSVVAGFTQGIGGTTGVAPMKVGGRRIMIVPSTLGYGATANGTIPANSTLVFIVDLLKVTPASS